MKLSAIFTLATLLLMGFTINATTLSIYSSRGKCTYVLLEGNREVARWSAGCTMEVYQARQFTIVRQSPLAKRILKINPAQNLKNILVIYHDKAEREKEDTPEIQTASTGAIQINDREFKKSIIIHPNTSKHGLPNKSKINSSSNGTKSSAIDYNSSLSNNINGIVAPNPTHTDQNTETKNALYVGGIKKLTSNNNNADTTPVRQEAQDYNSSRSNKANGLGTINNADNNSGNDGDSTDKVSDTKNKKQVTNPLYENKGLSGSNPMYEGKSMSGGSGDQSQPKGQQPRSIVDAQDYNSSRSNRKESGAAPNPDADTTKRKSSAQDYNSSRSNRKESGLAPNPDGDTTKRKSSAQDYNSSRSNRTENGVITNPDADTTKRKSPAQDYNSSRSNRTENGVITNPDADTTKRKSPAQDYNSSRSNRTENGVAPNPSPENQKIKRKNPLYQGNNTTTENPIYTGITTTANGEKEIYIGNKANRLVTIIIKDTQPDDNDSIPSHQEAQNYNSSRSNKANGLVTINVINNTNGKQDSVPPHQEAQNYNSSRSNKANGLVTINVINSTCGKQDSVPSPQEAQNYNSSRSNKANGLVANVGGGTGGSGGHAGNGWNIHLGYQIPIDRILKFETGLGYSSWNFKFAGSVLLPERFAMSMQQSIERQSWKAITISAGPAIQMGHKRLSATFYGRAGLTFLTTPRQFIGFFDEGKVNQENGLARFSGNHSVFSIQTGIRINYEVNRKLCLFLNPNFFTIPGKSITYSEKDVSKAIDADGNFLYEKFMSLPFEQQAERLQCIGLSLGVRVAL